MMGKLYCEDCGKVIFKFKSDYESAGICATCRKKRDDIPQLEIDGDTGELYTPVGMLKKEWADAARKNAEQKGHKGE